MQVQVASHQRWQALCSMLSPHADVAVVRSLFESLEVMYRTPARAYHNMSHIAECLAQFDRWSAAKANPQIEWALWWHDSVYEPTNKDNEEKSAKASSVALAKLQVRDENIDKLILATKHTGASLQGDLAIIADIDLSVLARSPSEYDAYAKAIREEYAFVSDADYIKGRATFLRGLLSREHIFSSAYGREAWQQKARKNLAREVSELECNSPGRSI